MKNILIVDDEELIRSLNKRLLEKVNYGVRTAVNGTEAFDYFTQNTVDAVVTDYNMPGGNGLELIKNLRKSNFKGPIILYCSQPEDIVQGALEAGADRFIPKPSKNFMDIPETLTELLDKE